MKEKNKIITIDWQPDKQSKIPIYEQIVDYISKKVSSGDWLLNSKLPPQRELARLFNVNRSTIVTAMDELIALGILDTAHGAGTRVASNSWSLLMSNKTVDWSNYVSAGSFKENVPTIQVINKLEFNDYIRLGTGEISPSLFPREMFKQINERISDKVYSLNYLEPLGLLELRITIAKRLEKQGILVDPSSILITSGSLQALQLISLCMVKSGSKVFCETPTYLKSLHVFQSAGIDLAGIPSDQEGIKFWMLDNLIGKSSIEPYNNLLYTIPTFQNPTGKTMSLSRRKDLLEYCQTRQLPIIEDTAYNELWLDQEPPMTLKAMDDTSNVIYIGTVSKTLAPGLRIGWLVGPQSVVERLGDVKMQIDYGASSVSQWILNEFIASGMYDEHLTHLRLTLKQRRANALQQLDLHFSDIAQWDIPDGGFYIWLQITRNVSIDKVFAEALKHKILLNPGYVYDFKENNAIRLSYAYEEPHKFNQALKILAKVINAL